MADLISIKMAVVGLLQVSSQMSTLLSIFINAVWDAPKQAKLVLTEVDETRAVLSHLQTFLLRMETVDLFRRTLVQIDEMVAILSGCVATFSELEATLDILLSRRTDFWDNLKWTRNESKIAGLIERIQ